MPVQRAAITGAPGAGKSTLLAELSRRGVTTVEEVARTILRSAGGMALREEDPLAFADAMLSAQLAAWDETQAEGPIVFDRGFPDIAGFLRVEGLPVSAAIARACDEYRFEGPIFRAPPWRAIYTPDDERIQDWQEAVASDRAVSGAWRDYGYALIDLPLAPAKERAAFILSRL
ncbi:MAG: AAA family ATPase [Qipengyuania sp.]